MQAWYFDVFAGQGIALEPHALQRLHYHPASSVDGRDGGGADWPQFCRLHGGDFLRTFGQPDWTASEAEAYVAAAKALAQDIAHLRPGRPALRA